MVLKIYNHGEGLGFAQVAAGGWASGGADSGSRINNLFTRMIIKWPHIPHIIPVYQTVSVNIMSRSLLVLHRFL